MVIVSADTSKVHAGETSVRKHQREHDVAAADRGRAPRARRPRRRARTARSAGPAASASASAAWTCAASWCPSAAGSRDRSTSTDGVERWPPPAPRRGSTGPSRRRRSTRRAAGRSRTPAAPPCRAPRPAAPSTRAPAPAAACASAHGLGHAGNANQRPAPRRVATPARLRSPSDERPRAPLLDWYDAHARELPWRGEQATPWSVMVSEFMLQQTPVARVEPVHRQWLETWPTPADLAAAPSGEAVRAWGRLGYPRRALRLHAAATAIVERYDGRVPSAYDDLRALPGVGDYTAAAIATFGFGRRHAVLDTNVRRVLARLVSGVELPPVAATAGREAAGREPAPRRRGRRRHLVDRADGARRAGLHGGQAEVRARARSPTPCAWRAAGYPAYDGPPRKAQTWAGTDRQCRGRLLAVVRDAEGAVPAGTPRPGLGRRRPNETAAWPPCSPTASSSRSPRVTRCRDSPSSRKRPRAVRTDYPIQRREAAEAAGGRGDAGEDLVGPGRAGCRGGRGAWARGVRRRAGRPARRRAAAAGVWVPARGSTCSSRPRSRRVSKSSSVVRSKMRIR